MPADSDGLGEVADHYRAWASDEARGESACYERLALAVADDPFTLSLLHAVEPVRRQPNLFFGALRWLGAPVDDPPATVAWLRSHDAQVLEVISTRRTQTNEVGRCATLLPALALLPQPLALVEVGSSAGLCLLYDRWRYHYTGPGIDHWVGPERSPVTLPCTVDGPVPLPDDVPVIAWRAGLDLNPIDTGDPEDRQWLRALVWPEHSDRAERLTAALEVAGSDPPHVRAGDLVHDLDDLLAQAPSDATVVVTHSAVLTYVKPAERDAFRAIVAGFGAHRLGAEGGRVLPDITARIEGEVGSRFVVSLDDEPLAHGHGRSLSWLG